jgi:hypothetical protein
MKMLYKVAILSFFFSLSYFSVEGYGQSKSMRDIEKRSHKNEGLFKKAESKKVRRAEEKAEKQKEKQKEKYEKAKKEDNERRMNMQTPETKKRMKDSRKKADSYNSQGREPFFKRLFKRKKPKSL